MPKPKPNKPKRPQWLILILLLVLALLLVVIGIGPGKKTEVAKRQHHALPELPAPPPPIWQAPQVEKGLALIIDDAGYDLGALRRILALDVPVAISVIPDAPHAREAAEMAHQAGRPVMLHLPMQPISPKIQARMTPAFLRDSMNADTLRNTFLDNLAMVPYVEGVNNHMGSYLTQLEAPMQTVMQVCFEQQLFFVDSRTSQISVAAAAAKAAGLAWVSRDIFLDHNIDEAFLAHQWQLGRRCVAQGRRCVMIAHPHPETVAFLERNVSEEDAKMMVTIREVLHSEDQP